MAIDGKDLGSALSDGGFFPAPLDAGSRCRPNDARLPGHYATAAAAMTCGPLPT